MSVQPISNEDMKLGDVPTDALDWDHFVRFAQSFNGYEAAGSFEDAAQIANQHHLTNGSGRIYSFAELRICLFFEYRRWNHFGRPRGADDITYQSFLISEIRKIVSGCSEP
jgi:hypothetical protein